MQLHYRLRISNHVIRVNSVMIVIHGLFGSLSNLGIIATNLIKYHCVIQVDLRNHGYSPHSKSMNYVEMAQDIFELLDKLQIKKCSVIGHSMGGKVAMTMCMIAAHRVSKVIIIDIAPIKYNVHQYDDVFCAIEYVNQFDIKNRSEAKQLLQIKLFDQALILFLLKSFSRGFWIFNFSSIKENYHIISDWNMYGTWWGPALFIRGSLSSYISNKYISDIYHQFPYSHIYTIFNAGHWILRDNPVHVLKAINEFI